jgi:hypothetical protein
MTELMDDTVHISCAKVAVADISVYSVTLAFFRPAEVRDLTKPAP